MIKISGIILLALLGTSVMVAQKRVTSKVGSTGKCTSSQKLVDWERTTHNRDLSTRFYSTSARFRNGPSEAQNTGRIEHSTIKLR